MSKIKLYDQLSRSHEAKWAQLKAYIEREGYGAFRDLVEEFKSAIKTATEIDEQEVVEHIDVAERLFPDPAKFSPSWQFVWRELRDMLHWKVYVYRKVPPGDREGEWQILMDNPYTNQEVVCYPGLTFDDAANLFAYFRPNLVKNEYLRMQKVSTAITEHGGGVL